MRGKINVKILIGDISNRELGLGGIGSEHKGLKSRRTELRTDSLHLSHHQASNMF